MRFKPSFICGRRPRRYGFSLIEIQVSFVLLGIALAGLCPLIVMQLKLSKKILGGFNRQTMNFAPDQPYYLVPPTGDWEAKLGIAASVSTFKSDSGSDSGAGSSATKKYDVTITSAPVRSISTGEVSVTVLVKTKSN